MSDFHIVDPRFSHFLRDDSRVEKLFSGMKWAEGPVYLPGEDCLIVSDIPNDRLLRWSEKTGTSVFREPSNYANGNILDREGCLVTCEHGARRVTRTGRNGKVEVLADVYKGKKLNSPNDVVVKSDGSVWFTDPTYGIRFDDFGHVAPQEQEGAYVFRLDPGNGALEVVAENFVAPNGLAFSPDETLLYIADSGGDLETSFEQQADPSAGRFPDPHNIQVFDVVLGKKLVDGRLFVDIAPGVPDGIRIDSEGNLWAGAFDGVHCYAPGGKLLGRIVVPEVVANLCFGGPGRDWLYMAATTSLYRVRLRRRGI